MHCHHHRHPGHAEHRHGPGRGFFRAMGREGRFGRGDMDVDSPRQGGRRRQFDGDSLRLLLLKLIADKPRHGYDAIREIEERTGGAYAPSAGVIYPTLTLLTEMGLIAEQESGGARKQYAVTPEGQAHLSDNADEVARILARLDAMSALRERTDSAPVRRAMHNLRHVLQNRLGAGLDRDKVLEAVEMIDEVARKIERL